MKIVLASSNQGKIREMQAMFAKSSFEIIPQTDFGVEDAEEIGLTYVENAILKARHASEKTNLPALADDSGLIVPALNGQPGIYSARFAGLPQNREANIDKLLTLLQNETNRTAYCHCTLVLMRHALDPEPIICSNNWKVEILNEKPLQLGGFGYEPILYAHEFKKTLANMSLEIKNSISHRAKSCTELIEYLNKHNLYEYACT